MRLDRRFAEHEARRDLGVGETRIDAVIHNAGVYTGRRSCPSTSSLPTCSLRSSTLDALARYTGTRIN